MKNILIIIAWLFPVCLTAAPYNGEIMSFRQPDGTTVDVRLYGTEFYVRAEGLDDYTVIRDKNTQWICYATLSEDGSEFISTGVKYTLTRDKIPALKMDLNIARHLEISFKARDAVSSHFDAKPAIRTLSGVIKGLCIVVDFSDEPGTLPVNEFESFCNNMDYNDFGNNGSLRKYYYDISGGIVDYQNVVFGYFRAPKTFAHYDSLPEGYGAAEILELALKWIDSEGFDFSTLSLNPDSTIMAINLMYTGMPKSWNFGMWWHQSVYPGFSADGVHSRYYNCSIGYSPLSLGTVVHENGHMLFNWDDTYKYDKENGPDGIGSFDLMCNNGNAFNPVPPNPYFMIKAGMGNVVDITNYNGNISDDANDNTYYLYKNANDTNEFFIFDNRSKTGRSYYIPEEGLTVWHIDERGDNQSLHNEVYLVHANNNQEDTKDICFHAGLKSEFSDTTRPGSAFYDGNSSRLILHDIGMVADPMTCMLGPVNSQPVVKLTYVNISDDDNLNGFPEPGESLKINMEIGNSGTADLGSATIRCEAIGENREFVSITSPPLNLDNINVSENIPFDVNLSIAANTPLRKVITLKFSVSGENDSASYIREFVVGKEIYMANQQISACSTIFYDRGGRTRNYASRDDLTLTLLAPSAGSSVKVEFFSFDLEASDICEFDYLNIYNGPTTSSPLIGTYCGKSNPGTLESTDPSGALTFRFHSDGAVTGTGWEAFITCIDVTGLKNKQEEDNSFEIYPNPSGNNVFVKINLNNSQNLRLVLVDAGGKEVAQFGTNGQPLVEINRNNIPGGVYYFQLWDKKHLVSTRKMVWL
jgi:M6 family metalloprotease-like protein